MSEDRTAREENLRIVRSSIDAYNSHDVNQAIEYEAESVVIYSPDHLTGITGREAAINSVTADFVACPDIHLKIEQIIGQGDWVSVQGILTGTHTGPMMTEKGRTIKATNRRISIPQAYFHRLQDGKIVETHSYYDIRYGIGQLGLLRKNVLKTWLLIAFGLALMALQATILYDQRALFQVLYTLLIAVPVIWGAAWLGKRLLAFSRID